VTRDFHVGIRGSRGLRWPRYRRQHPGLGRGSTTLGRPLAYRVRGLLRELRTWKSRRGWRIPGQSVDSVPFSREQRLWTANVVALHEVNSETWSPEREQFHLVVGESTINADEDEALQPSLRNQHAVEGIGMVRRKIASGEGMRRRNRERAEVIGV
jgi:hypothetical protein